VPRDFPRRLGGIANHDQSIAHAELRERASDYDDDGRGRRRSRIVAG